MNKKCSYIVKIGLFTAFLIAIDQISKFLATVCLKGKNDFVIIKDVFCFHYLDGGKYRGCLGNVLRQTFSVYNLYPDSSYFYLPFLSEMLPVYIF